MERRFSRETKIKERRRLVRSKSLCTAASRRHLLESCYEFANSGIGYLQRDNDSSSSDPYLSSIKSLESLHIAASGTVSPLLTRRFSDGYQSRSSGIHRRHRSSSRTGPSQPRARTDMSQSEFKATSKNQQQDLALNRCLYRSIKDQSNKSSASRLRRIERLASTVEACGSETARAKAIALRIKESRAQRCKDLKLELQERLLKAEERRNKIYAEAKLQRHLAEERKRKQREAKLAAEALRTASRGKQQSKLGERHKDVTNKTVKLMSTSDGSHNVDYSSDAEVDDGTNRSMQDAIRQHSIKRKRSSSLTPFQSYETDKRAMHAIILIQRAFRSHRRRLALCYFKIQKRSLEECTAKGFDNLADRLSQSIVIDSAMAALKALGLGGFQGDNKQSVINTRNFLAAYMIVSFPESVFTTSTSDLETNVKQKAEALLHAFEDVAHNTSNSVRENIDELFASYLECLNQWKDADRENLSSTMLERYCSLETLKRNIAHEVSISCIDIDPIAGQQYIDGIKQNQLLILSKLRNLFGGSDIVPRVREALRAEHEKGSWPSSRTSRNIRDGRNPRGNSTTNRQALRVSGLDAEDQLDGTNSAKENHKAHDAINEALASSKRPSTELNDGESGIDFSQFLSTNILGNLSNRSLVHRILLDDNYHLTRQDIPRNDLAKAVIESFETISNRQESEEAKIKLFSNEYHILMAAVQYKLLCAVPKGSSSYLQIDEYFTKSLFLLKAKSTPFSSTDAVQFIDFVTSNMKRICSPGRDELIRGMSDKLSVDPDSTLPEIIVKLTEGLPCLFEALDYLQLDFINYFMQQAAIVIKQYGLSYEEGIFKEMVDKGEISLKATREWLACLYHATAQKTSERDPEDNGHPANAEVTLESFISHGIVDLIIGNARSATPLAVVKVDGEDSNILVPETFEMDIEDLNSIKDSLRNVIVATALSLAIRNASNFSTTMTIPKSSSSNFETMSTETMQEAAMKIFLILEDSNNCDNAIDRVYEGLQEYVPHIGDDNLHQLIKKVSGGKDPIVGLLLRRLRLAGYKAFQLEFNRNADKAVSTQMATGRIASQGGKPSSIGGIPLNLIGETLGLDSKLGFSRGLVEIISKDISRLVSIGTLQLKLHRRLFIKLLREITLEVSQE